VAASEPGEEKKLLTTGKAVTPAKIKTAVLKKE